MSIKKHLGAGILAISILVNSAVLPAQPIWAEETSKPHALNTELKIEKTVSAKENLVSGPPLLTDKEAYASMFGTGLQLDAKALGLKSAKVLVQEFDTDNGLLLHDYIDLSSSARFNPASMTKVMTVLLVCEAIESGRVNGDSKLVCDEDVLDDLAARNASIAGLVAGEEYSINDLLYAALITSGNDASRMLVYSLAKTEDEFVALMNDKARSLNLQNTHFDNCTGLSAANHYSSLRDISAILKDALRNRLFLSIISERKHTTAPTETYPEGIDLPDTITQYTEGWEVQPVFAIQGKTGFEDDSLYCFTSFYYFNNRLYIVSTANAPEFSQNIYDHEAIYTKLFTATNCFLLLNNNTTLMSKEVEGAKNETHLEFRPSEPLYAYLPPAFHTEDLNVDISMPAVINAPLEADTTLGYLRISYSSAKQKTELHSEVLRAGQKVEASFLALLVNVYSKYIAYLIAALLLLLMFFLVVRSFKRNRNTYYTEAYYDEDEAYYDEADDYVDEADNYTDEADSYTDVKGYDNGAGNYVAANGHGDVAASVSNNVAASVSKSVIDNSTAELDTQIVNDEQHIQELSAALAATFADNETTTVTDIGTEDGTSPSSAKSE